MSWNGLLVLYAVVLAALAAFVLEAFAWRRFIRKPHLLNHEGRWTELEGLIRRELRAFRPFVKLFLRFKSPGVLEALYAALLYNLGRIDECLEMARKAALLARNYP